MSRNRVEELESKVAELQSTVTGLTEELVEAKDRIRDLEAELEPEPADGSQFAGERRVAGGGTDAGGTDGRAGEGSGPTPDAGQVARSETAPGGQSPGAVGDEGSAGEGDKGEASQEEDETAGSKPGDDIIVA